MGRKQLAMRILVTGAAGFIGYHVCQRLLNDAHILVGVDNLNDYYDVTLKHARLERLRHREGFDSEYRGPRRDGGTICANSV